MACDFSVGGNRSHKQYIKAKNELEILNMYLDKSNYLVFGARKIDKILEDEIEGIIIDQIIEGNKVVKL